MTTLNGILGIHEMKHTTVKILKSKKTIPPDQYLLDSMYMAVAKPAMM